MLKAVTNSVAVMLIPTMLICRMRLDALSADLQRKSENAEKSNLCELQKVCRLQV